jgi:malic enzyme
MYTDILLNSSSNEKCFRKKIVKKTNTRILYPIIFSPENLTVNEIT